MNTTNNKCPGCGADINHRDTVAVGYACFDCDSWQQPEREVDRSDFCREREARQKAEEQYLEMAEAASEAPDLQAEVARLRELLNRAIEELSGKAYTEISEEYARLAPAPEEAVSEDAAIYAKARAAEKQRQKCAPEEAFV